MKTIANIILLLSLSNAQLIWAQDFSTILQSIEAHSLKLVSARQEAEAQKADSRAEISVEGLDVGFNYLWGKDGIGPRKDLNVSQTFDFPTVMIQRHKMSREMQRVYDLEYLNERQRVLLAAHKLCIQVVYCNAMMDHLNEDLHETQMMAQAYETLYQKGEATIIDYNKAHQELLFFQAEYREFVAMKENLLSELQCMNGGEVVIIEDTMFVHEPLPTDFDAWLNQHIDLRPEMLLASGELTASQQSLRVAKNRWAPGIRIGYMSELTREEKYHGPTVGMTFPLWNNGRKVKASRLHEQASATAVEETRMHLRTELQGVYRDAMQLQETFQVYKHHLDHHDNAVLLQKSLDAGQISLITYLQERQYVHEMHVRLLETERDLQLRMAELKVY